MDRLKTDSRYGGRNPGAHRYKPAFFFSTGPLCFLPSLGGAMLSSNCSSSCYHHPIALGKGLLLNIGSNYAFWVRLCASTPKLRIGHSLLFHNVGFGDFIKAPLIA